MTSILITGVTSYIGLNVARHLQNQGHDIHVLVRPTTNMDRFRDFELRPTVHVFDWDEYRAQDTLNGILKVVSPNVLVHLAGTYVNDHGFDDVSGLVADNIRFGTQILEAMRHSACDKIVCVGSYFQYADYALPRATNLYAATKLAFEEILKFYADAYGIAAVKLVVFDTYGPGEWRPRLMPAIRRAQVEDLPLALVSENICLDFLHIDDICRAFEAVLGLLLTNDGKGRLDVYSLSSGRPVTLDDLIVCFEKIGGKAIERKWGVYKDQSRQAELLWEGPTLPGWSPKVALEQGVQEFIAELDKSTFKG